MEEEEAVRGSALVHNDDDGCSWENVLVQVQMETPAARWYMHLQRHCYLTEQHVLYKG